MNRNTIIWVVLAILAAGGAYAMQPVEVVPESYEDTGEELFQGFEDPSIAGMLEVKTWDAEEAHLKTFRVELRDGRWVIPSHNDYPADATERMGKAAASLIGVRKDVVRSDDPKEHAEFGVQDPEDPSSADGGRGQRIAVADKDGSPLADVIIGKDVPDKEGFKYARLPEQNRVYAVKIELDISTAFTDWIEKDLLKFDKKQVVKLVSNSYRVDEETKKVLDRNPLTFVVEDTGELEADGTPKMGWVVAEGLVPPEGKELNPTKAKQTFGAAARVKISGVRPRPPMLNSQVLAAKGFFVAADGSRLFGNEGEIEIFCDDGVIYRLYFGEVTYDKGLALTAGGEGEGAAEEDKANANRYMFAEAYYDPAVDRGPEAYMPELEEGEEPPLRGKARAEALQKRFSQWFYVIPNSSFSQMHKEFDDFWRDKKD